MAKREDFGNGDVCPLFPDHGRMYVIKDSDPKKQYCPHQVHDGGVRTSGIPASRAMWPLYGFEDTVKTYMARLDKAIRESALPDLSDVEVL